jgi:hypothetical protein
LTDHPIDAGQEAAAAARRARRRRWFQAAAVALIGACGLAGFGGAYLLKPPPGHPAPLPAADEPAGSKLPGHLFRGWDKPDLVVVVSASQHGYLLPCGCSRPQKGGLERRYNFLQLLKERGWPVVALDLGDVPQKQGPAQLPNLQGLIKYRYAMRAMKLMGYAGVGLGEYEASLPLFKALGEWSLNDPEPPVLAANLLKADESFPGETRPYATAGDKLPVRVGVTAVVGPQVAGRIADPAVRFQLAPPTNSDLKGAASSALDAVLKQMPAEKVEFPVLLYMGSAARREEGFPPEAVACAKSYPQFPLVVALDDSDEPAGNPLWVDAKAGAKTMVVAVGHKAKYVGVVGVWRRPGRPFELRYELVEMSEEFLTPASREADQSILKLMEEYTAELKRDDYLGQYPQVSHPSQAAVKEGAPPKYVGSERCGDCHKSAYAVWEHTDHHHAYHTLEEAKRPGNRQYDPECIVCHTVGFGYKGGFTHAAETPKLKDVGCESCHGPGSRHANNPNDAEWLAVMNPWKAPENETDEARKKRQGRVADLCVHCHDSENDVNWTRDGFEQKWAKIAHPTPASEK